MRIESYIAIWIILSAVILLNPLAYRIAHGFIQLLLGGYSFGKTVVLLVWQIALGVLIWAHKKYNIRIITGTENNWKYLTIALIIAFGLNMSAQLFLTHTNGFPYKTVPSVLVSHNGQMEWEASQIYHVHAVKGTVNYLLSILGIQIHGADTGYAIQQIMPFSMAWAVLFTAIEAIIIFFAIREAVLLYKDRITKEFVLFSIAIIGLIIGVIDGGILTQNVRICTGLYILYLAIRYIPRKNGWVVLALPVTAVILVQSFVRIPLNIRMALYSEVNLLLGISLFFAIKEVHLKGWKLVATAAFCAIILVPTLYAALTFGFGTYLPAGSTQYILIYGIPQNTPQSIVTQILSKYGDVNAVEKNSWSAMAKLTMKKDTYSSEIEDALRNTLKNKSYLYVVVLGRMKERYILYTSVAQDIPKIQFNKEFVIVKNVRYDPNYDINYLVVNTRAQPTWSGLFIEDALHTKLRKELPVVLDVW